MPGIDGSLSSIELARRSCGRCGTLAAGGDRERRRTGASVDSVTHEDRVRRNHALPPLARARARPPLRELRRALELVGAGARDVLGVHLGLLRGDLASPVSAGSRAPVMPGARWFEGATVNYAEQSLWRALRPEWKPRTALVFESESRPRF